MSDNRFRDVINSAREREQQPVQQPQQQHPGAAAPAQQQPRRGRPPGGKRSNAEYVQVSTYVKKETYRRVKIRLLEMEPEGEFGDLVEHLLARWLQSRAG